MFYRGKHKAEEKDIKEAVTKLKKGSAEAFHILYHKYQNRIYRFCLRMLNDEAAAKDAFQETFIRVFEHRKDFRGTNFTAWLFTIARHTCLNMIRSKKEHETFDEVFHTNEQAGETDIGLKNYINKSISILPPALKEALVLREYEEYSYQEIAEILDIELSLAKVRVHRARIILRKLLKPIRKELHES